jgi:hypothetical protein
MIFIDKTNRGEGGVSNMLFDTLADWELQLKRSEVRLPGLSREQFMPPHNRYGTQALFDP